MKTGAGFVIAGLMLFSVISMTVPQLARSNGAPPPGKPDGWKIPAPAPKCRLPERHFNGQFCFECEIKEEGKSRGLPLCGEQSLYKKRGFRLVCTENNVINPRRQIWCKPSPGAEGPVGDKKSAGCTVSTVGCSRSVNHSIFDSIICLWLLFF